MKWKNLEKQILNGSDYAEFLIPLKELVNRGWNFDCENSYGLFSKDFETYEDYVENAEAQIFVREGQVKCLDAPIGSNWQNADSHYNAGDNTEDILTDLIELSKYRTR